MENGQISMGAISYLDMLSVYFSRWFVVAGLVMGLALRASALPKSPAEAGDRIVVIISVDGLSWFYLNDPKSDVPTLRRLAAEGAVAERMEASLPTVTWPNHTTLVTGVSPAKHGVLANNYWDRDKMTNVRLLPDPVFDKEEIVKAPTIYDVVKAANLKTAGINWPASRGAKSLDWRTPDVQIDELYQAKTTPALLEEFRAAGIPFEKQQEWCRTGKGEERDRMYTKMLIHVIEKHRPNVALLHLVEVDHAEHAAGPRSEEAYREVHFEDERIKEIWEALERSFPGKATLIVTSDHGFIAVRQRIQPNVKLRMEGLLKVEDGKMTERRAFAMDQGGSSFIYILDKEHRAELIEKIAGMFQGVEGIDMIITPKDFKVHGLVSPEKDARMADLVLTAKDGYAFSDNAAGDVLVTPKSDKVFGAHGHSPLLPDMYASFIAWGADIKKGARIGKIDNRDVAPTAAALLGVKMKGVEGRVLKEILVK